MESNIFVYGRTKNQDYRWLQKPNIALNSSFFARILENNSNSLQRDKKLFVFISTPNLYMLAYIFKDFSSVDERGRPISFVVGLACNAKEGREFNYRLPALLQQHNLITNLIKNDLAQVINSNSSFNIKDFDIKRVTYIENEKFLLDIEDNNATLNSSLLEMANKLNNKISTPSLESNFNLKDINNVLKEENNFVSEKEEKLNINISSSVLKSDFKVKDTILEETNNFVVKDKQEYQRKITPSCIESKTEIIDNNISSKDKEENKINNSLINQLNNFTKDKNKEDIPIKELSNANKFNKKKYIISELEEIIKFRPSSILAKFYNEEGEKGGLFTTKIFFNNEKFLTLHKKLKTYDNQVLNVCEKVIKIIDKS